MCIDGAQDRFRRCVVTGGRELNAVGVGPVDDLDDIDGVFARREAQAVVEHDFVDVGFGQIEVFGDDFAQACGDLIAGVLDGRAVEIRTAGGGSCRCIGHFVGARVHQADVFGLDTEFVRCDRDQFGVQG